MGFQDVLDHIFFQSRGPNDATLERLSAQIETSHSLLQSMDGKLDEVLKGLSAHFNMLSTLLHGAEKIAPRLICFLPIEALSPPEDTDRKRLKWYQNALRPKNWLNTSVLVFFVEPIGFRLAPTNPNDKGVAQGFEIKFQNEWVTKMMPYVKLGLATLKIAAHAGRLTGFPVPDVAGVVGGWIDEQLGMLDDLKTEAKGWLSEQTKDENLAGEYLDRLDSYASNVANGIFEDARPAQSKDADDKLREPIEKSFEELDQLLPRGWRDKSGLVPATAREGTRTEWVLKEDKERFEREGIALLGQKDVLEEIKPNHEETEARDRARSTLTSQKEQIEKIQQGQPKGVVGEEDKLDMILERVQQGQPRVGEDKLDKILQRLEKLEKGKRSSVCSIC